jgi:hypothetical protein
MMHRRPIHAIWTGTAFVPENRDLNYCKHWFGAGETFVLDPEQERDMNSHRHYFAQLKEAWRNLPETLEHKYPNEEIFRKKLLVECGYFHESEMVCDTARDAATVAAFMAPLDPSATIVVHGNVIKKYVAMSQSVVAMGRKEFQQSKWDVLNAAASLINVTSKQLEKNAGRSA